MSWHDHFDQISQICNPDPFECADQLQLETARTYSFWPNKRREWLEIDPAIMGEFRGDKLLEGNWTLFMNETAPF